MTRYPAGFEWVKWIAFAAMVCDHVDLLVFGRSLPVLYGIGRVALPVFLFTFAYGAALSSDPLRLALRVGLVGLVAQGVWALVHTPLHYANVLLVMAGLAVVAWLPALWLRVLFGGVLAVCGPFLEGGTYAVGLAVGVALGARRVGPYGCALAALGWAVIAWAPGALVAAALLGLACVLDGPVGRRSGRWLLWAYPAHLVALAGLSVALAGRLALPQKLVAENLLDHARQRGVCISVSVLLGQVGVERGLNVVWQLHADR